MGLRDALLDIGMRQARAEEPAPGRFEESGLQRGVAQAGQDPGDDVPGQVTRPGERLRVVQGLFDGVVAGADAYGGALTAVDGEDGGGQPQVLQGLRQASVVGADDDLAVLGEGGEDAGEAVHLGGVHGLHRVVDDEKPEGVLWEEGAREETRTSAPSTTTGSDALLCVLGAVIAFGSLAWLTGNLTNALVGTGPWAPFKATDALLHPDALWPHLSPTALNGRCAARLLQLVA